MQARITSETDFVLGDHPGDEDKTPAQKAREKGELEFAEDFGRQGVPRRFVVPAHN